MEHEMTTVIFWAKGAIAPAYLIIAYLLWSSSDGAVFRTRPGRAVSALVVIFILCDFASYIGPLIGVPMTVSAALHVLLAFLVWLFIQMRQTSVIGKALRDD